MDKRAFLAVILSLMILVIYQEWVTRYYGDPPPPPAPEKQKAEEPVPAVRPAPAKPAQSVPPQIPVGEKAKEIKVETDHYIALFTSLGGRLKSFTFKQYRRSVNENSPPFEIVPSAPGVPHPLGVRWQAETAEEDSGLVYGAVQGGNLNLTGDAKGTLTFKGQSPAGTAVTKTFTFSGSRYPIGFEISVKASEGRALVPEVLLTEKSDHTQVNPDAHFEGFIALVDNKIHREPPADAVEGKEISGDIDWAGFGYTYFLFALLPADNDKEQVTLRQSGAALVAALAPQGSPKEVYAYTLFSGPKELETLKAVGNGLERSIDFGYFGFIAIPFLYVLHFLHGFTGSYGIDIILLTVFIKILMAPLTHKSFVSMKQMQKLQPQMERLKEKFKNDREKLNKEIMELYRRNGVNPLGGCLPMLLQFPVFIGLYNALSTPIELRHAPFLWIKDLSRPDWESLPFTIGDWHLGIPVLTLLMGASMFVQQWMTPTAGDPNQRRMMLMMPVVFTFMFVSFPAGLTVYWLVNNVLTIGQQYWINRQQ